MIIFCKLKKNFRSDVEFTEIGSDEYCCTNFSYKFNLHL